MLVDAVRSALFNQCRVREGQTILQGFSGGADSLCLLYVLTQMPLKVIAATFNHGLREESQAEVEHCRRVAEELGCEFITEAGDVQGTAARKHLSLEEAARILRYQFLFDAAISNNADAVAVAHNADDQVETVLMHLLRGAGSSGLSGMPYRSGDPLGRSTIPLIRPLLGVWRTDIRDFCRESGLIAVEDASNQDPTYFRNRLRLELLPDLETYNVAVKKHLWQTASILAEENAGLDEEVNRALPEILSGSGKNWRQLHVQTFNRFPYWLKRRTVRSLLHDLKSTLRDIDFYQVENCIKFMAHPSFGKICQVGEDFELFCVDHENVLLVERSFSPTELWPQVPGGASVPLCAPGEIALAGGWRLRLHYRDQIRIETLGKDPWQAVVDAATVISPLSLGRPEKGETFNPYGMEKTKVKLGDFFTNVHLPARARADWPVVRSGDRIIWIPGYRIADDCKVTPHTQKYLCMELKRETA